MSSRKEIKSVSVCTKCNRIYEGLAQHDEQLPCGHPTALFYKGEALAADMKKFALRPDSCKVNIEDAKILSAYGMAKAFHKMAKPLSYILALISFLAGLSMDPSVGTLFMAFGGTIFIGAYFFDSNYPGKYLMDKIADKFCPVHVQLRLDSQFKGREQ